MSYRDFPEAKFPQESRTRRNMCYKVLEGDSPIPQYGQCNRNGDRRGEQEWGSKRRTGMGIEEENRNGDRRGEQEWGSKRRTGMGIEEETLERPAIYLHDQALTAFFFFFLFFIFIESSRPNSICSCTL